MKTVTRISSLVLSLAAAGVVYAQAPAATPAPAAGMSASADFTSVDQNKDGRVSSAEAQSHADLNTAFSTLDADRDSYLSQTEFQKWNKAGKAKDGASSPGAAPAQPRSQSESSSEASSEAK